MVDVANMYQFGAYTECFGISSFVLEQYQLRRLVQLRIFCRMAVRGVLAFYNGQTQTEGGEYAPAKHLQFPPDQGTVFGPHLR